MSFILKFFLYLVSIFLLPLTRKGSIEEHDARMFTLIYGTNQTEDWLPRTCNFVKCYFFIWSTIVKSYFTLLSNVILQQGLVVVKILIYLKQCKPIIWLKQDGLYLQCKSVYTNNTRAEHRNKSTHRMKKISRSSKKLSMLDVQNMALHLTNKIVRAQYARWQRTPICNCVREETASKCFCASQDWCQ